MHSNTVLTELTAFKTDLTLVGKCRKLVKNGRNQVSTWFEIPSTAYSNGQEIAYLFENIHFVINNIFWLKTKVYFWIALCPDYCGINM